MKNKRIKFISVIFLFLFLRGTGFAQTTAISNPQASVSNAFSEGLSGVVVANTSTATGYQFYRLFALAWGDKPESERYSLSVVETRIRQRFSVVTVYFGNQSLFSASLPSRLSALQALVDQSLEAVSTKLLTIELGASDNDADMAGDGM